MEYELLIQQMRALLAGVEDQVACLANASALLNAALPNINWVGFYLAKDGALWLGPFQGAPACVRIGAGQGVCGAAFAAETYRARATCGRESVGSGAVAFENRRLSVILLSSSSSGISSTKRDGCEYCVRPYSRRRSAQVRYSCSFARVTAT